MMYHPTMLLTLLICKAKHFGLVLLIAKLTNELRVWTNLYTGTRPLLLHMFVLAG